MRHMIALVAVVFLLTMPIATAQVPPGQQQAETSTQSQGLDDLDGQPGFLGGQQQPLGARSVPGNLPPGEGNVAADRPSLHQSQKKEDDRIREGTELDEQLGVFRLTGDRITFFTEMGTGRFVVLENLALERVARVITDNPNQLKWFVTGTMTEYQGLNYLLIERAVLKTQVHSEGPVF